MGTTDGLTRSQRRAMRTRQAISRAGTVLFAQRGFADVTIAEITDRADVALGSFYNYFDNRDALIDQVLADAYESQRRFAVPIREHLGDSAEAHLLSLLLSMQHRTQIDPTWADLAHEAARAGRWAGVELVEAFIESVSQLDVSQRRTGRPVESPAWAAGVVRSLLGMVVDPACRAATEFMPIADQVRHGVTTFLQALGYNDLAIAKWVEAATTLPASITELSQDELAG